MDEKYTGFLRLLNSRPMLVVADFDDTKLGLLCLSINLNHGGEGNIMESLEVLV